LYLCSNMNDPLQIPGHLTIPFSELTFQFSRSGGKGGQNVNKVETKVELLFDVLHSPSLTESQRARLREKLSSRLDGSGTLHIISQESRSQWDNRERAITKFVELLLAALTPVKKRVKTRASRAAKQRRLDQKKRRGEIKKMRRSGTD
jgi:ribosome-associated protein